MFFSVANQISSNDWHEISDKRHSRNHWIGVIIAIGRNNLLWWRRNKCAIYWRVFNEDKPFQWTHKIFRAINYSNFVDWTEWTNGRTLKWIKSINSNANMYRWIKINTPLHPYINTNIYIACAVAQFSLYYKQLYYDKIHTLSQDFQIYYCTQTLSFRAYTTLL